MRRLRSGQRERGPRRVRRPRHAHPDVVLTLGALGAVLLLLALSHALHPPRVSLAEAAAREGARVEVEARVLDLREGARARWLSLTDGAHRMPAFAPRAPAIERGDVVRAAGIVSRLDDGLTLSLDTIEVVVPTARVVRDPAELAAAPEAFDGAQVVVAGEVRGGAIVGDGARIALTGDAPRAGDVIVTGTFYYHETDASYVIQVESWTPR